MTSLELPAAGLAALVVKYRTMVALRLSHGKGMPPAPKQALLALASDFPGALAELEVVPTDPNREDYRQGNTMGADFRHWRRAKIGRRFRLFFRFDSKSKVIV